jgi:hypothetical protein
VTIESICQRLANDRYLRTGVDVRRSATGTIDFRGAACLRTFGCVRFQTRNRLFEPDRHERAGRD